MKVLVVKTSSMGDILHTLPALSDAHKFIPAIQFDWVVEENFAEIPKWHATVDNVIPVAWRRWRKHLLTAYRQHEFANFYKSLTATQYDVVIDAQGLLKSAFITYLATGKRCGLNYRSAREPLASLCYQRRFAIAWQQHAVTRVRQLFANVFNYSLANTVLDYGIHLPAHAEVMTDPYLVFIHGTTWDTKLWPVSHWITLAQMAAAAKLKVLIPWGSSVEEQRAQQIAAHCANVQVLPKLKLAEIAAVLTNAKAVVAVDTGLGHLSAALSVNAVSLYGPTDPQLVGAYGHHQIHLRSPTQQMTDISAQEVWQKLQSILA